MASARPLSLSEIMQSNMNESTRERNHINAINVEKGFNIETHGRYMNIGSGSGSIHNIEITTSESESEKPTNEDRNNNETLHAIHLCTSLLFSSKIFQKFLVGNNVRTQLLQIEKNIE